MPDLLLELRSEEIPARMQRKAAGDLKKMVTDQLVEAGLTYEAAREYWTPRRLVLDIRGLTARSKDIREEIKGPSVSAPEQAVQGFLRKAGLSSIEEAHVHSDPKKGDFYVAHLSKPGRGAEEIIADVMPGIIRAFPWPKSMRWGPASAEPGSLRWVRPLQSILCTFGPETEETRIVPFEVDGIKAGNVTWGHRFHAPDMIEVRRFDDYVAKLEKAKVILDAERRKQVILADAKNLAFAGGLDLVEDEGLLEEVSGLVEWPVVLMGEFEEEFLEIPDEVTRLTIKTNQKCFVTRKGGKLSNRFILVANIEATDGGKEIAYGNGKVVRARLSDALYFWKTDQADLPDLGDLKDSAANFDLDLKKPLDQRMARLDHLNVTFHKLIGSQGFRVSRLALVSKEIAVEVGADPAMARRAAVLAKADLQTEVVGEFPEVQGAMGRTYALMQGEDAAVAAALEDHYKPQGPSDAVPSDPVSIAVALADKLITLAGFWAIDEKPTGSKDPFALRRAALGVIRILVENRIQLSLSKYISKSMAYVWPFDLNGELHDRYKKFLQIFDVDSMSSDEWVDLLRKAIGPLANEREKNFQVNFSATKTDLLSFFHERLKVYLRDQGARHDLIDAVLAGGGEGDSSNDDLLLVIRRVEALGAFLATEDGVNLLAGTKRAANILAAEEKKGALDLPAIDPALFATDEERALFDSLEEAERFAGQFIAKEDYEMALACLAALRQPIDAFFEAVMVNADDPAVRLNRLALLQRIRAATGQVADFSKIAG